MNILHIFTSGNAKSLTVFFGRGLIIVCFCWPVYAETSFVSQALQVVVEAVPEKQETDYRIVTESCEIEWNVYHSETNRGVIQQRSNCTDPLSSQTQLIAKLLAKVLENEGADLKFHTLYLGRLSTIPELSNRLVLLTKQSHRWDVQQGKPKKGYANPFVLELVNSGHLYQAWEEAFQEFHRQIKVSAVEKVLVSKAGKLPGFALLKTRGISAAEKLPYDCLIWLSVEKTPD